MTEILNSDCFTPEKQKARTFLRERFLRAVSSIVGNKCTFNMHSNTVVTGIFKGSDIEFKNILVDNLNTPYAQIPHSILRSTDVNYISFHELNVVK